MHIVSKIFIMELQENQTKYILAHYMQRKMLFYRFQSMVGQKFRVESYLQLLAPVNYARRKRIN